MKSCVWYRILVQLQARIFAVFLKCRTHIILKFSCQPFILNYLVKDTGFDTLTLTVANVLLWWLKLVFQAWRRVLLSIKSCLSDYAGSYSISVAIARTRLTVTIAILPVPATPWGLHKCRLEICLFFYQAKIFWPQDMKIYHDNRRTSESIRWWPCVLC
jgi:hypothetical protein